MAASAFECSGLRAASFAEHVLLYHRASGQAMIWRPAEQRLASIERSAALFQFLLKRLCPTGEKHQMTGDAPPSMQTDEPVMYEPLSDTMNATSSPISAGSAKRPSGMFLLRCA